MHTRAVATRQPQRFWDATEPAWRACLLLAWESFQAGSIPVGAVVVDETGTIVARGRNRRNERHGPRGQLSGSNLAHAEINALAALPPGEYPGHVLYSSLEPCYLCAAALRYSHIGTIRYAAADAMWSGTDRLPALNPHLARHWPRWAGPAERPLCDLAAVLHLLSAVERGVQAVVDCHADVMPDVLRLAVELAGPPADDLRRLPLTAALGELWPRLPTR
jgi:tRNA(adenine34) deaminase